MDDPVGEAAESFSSASAAPSAPCSFSTSSTSLLPSSAAGFWGVRGVGGVRSEGAGYVVCGGQGGAWVAERLSMLHRGERVIGGGRAEYTLEGAEVGL